MPGRGGEVRTRLNDAHPEVVHRLKPLLERHAVYLFQNSWHFNVSFDMKLYQNPHVLVLALIIPSTDVHARVLTTIAEEPRRPFLHLQ